MKYNKIINTISSATFGVYLIHDNPIMRSFLWHTLFKNATFSNNYFLIPYSLAVILIVFFGCTIIELFRIHLFEKYFIKFSNVISKFKKSY